MRVGGDVTRQVAAGLLCGHPFGPGERRGWDGVARLLLPAGDPAGCGSSGSTGDDACGSVGRSPGLDAPARRDGPEAAVGTPVRESVAPPGAAVAVSVGDSVGRADATADVPKLP